MPEGKPNAALLSFLRYEYAAELVQQINECRDKAHSQPDRRQEIPEFAPEHSPYHQDSGCPHHHNRKARFCHGSKQQIQCKENVISTVFLPGIFLLIYWQQLSVFEKCENRKRSCCHIRRIVERVRCKYAQILIFDPRQIDTCGRIDHGYEKQRYRHRSGQHIRKPLFSGQVPLQFRTYMLIQHNFQTYHRSAV